LFLCLLFFTFAMNLRVRKMMKVHIEREIDKVLLDWKNQIDRKPLMLRGARQVGKSTAVQELSKHFDYYIEINFEESLDVQAFFNGNLDPKTSL